MTQHDTTFVEGMLKQAAVTEYEQEKQAYGKRLTALLQRKGKLPTEAKPNVGVSSFPTTKQAFDSLFPLAGGLMGYSKENPVAGPVVGALAGYGAEKAWNSDAVRDVIGKGIDAVPGLRDFAVDHPLLAGAGAGLAGAGLGAGIYAGVKKLNNRFSSPSPATKQANADLLAQLQEYLASAKEHAGAGVEKLKDLGYQGKEMAEASVPSLGRGATRLNSFLKDNPIGSAAGGAALGGGIGALTGKSKNPETGEEGTRLRNALIGALLGGGAGAGAHHLSKEHGDAILQHARTSGVPVKPEYEAPHQQQGLNKLEELGIAPLNVGQNAPPSSVNIKPRF